MNCQNAGHIATIEFLQIRLKMQKVDSADELDETLEIVTENKSKGKKDAILRRSFSEDITTTKSQESLGTSSKKSKSKTRSRLSLAFRSLRGKKSSSLSGIEKSEKDVEVVSSECIEDKKKFDKLPLSPKAKKKKSKLTKKFSFGSIKRQKVAPIEDNVVSSGTQTPTNQRRTPEGGNLSLSEISLVNIPSDGDEAENPTTLDKVRKIQITISGRKTEITKVPLPFATTPITGEQFYTTSSSPASLETTANTLQSNPYLTPGTSERIDSSKVIVTQSERDTPPRERAPARPVQEPNQIKVASRDTSPLRPPVSPAVSDGSDRGAIRKTSSKSRLQRQLSRDEPIDSELLRPRKSSIERGRRYPRPLPPPIDQSFLPEPQQHQTNQQRVQNFIDSNYSGNNLQNPNLSGSIIDQPSSEIKKTISPQVKRRFALGKKVRQITVIHRAFPDSKDYSSIESSTGSLSPLSDGGKASRRRIRYIDQATFYTDEEKEILEGKREALSNLSGISECSFDSDLSVDSQMPAFGDLTMDPEQPPIMTSSSTEKREHLYKILVIGELGTGKTSFIKRYVHQFFSQNYRATIGVDFALKVLHWDQNTIVRLQLWDIAGQERFGNMTRVYYKEAVGAFIVFDVTRSGTFDAVSKWKEDLDSKVQLPDGSPIPCILLANKCDQEKQGIITTPEKMDEYVRDNGFAGWYETSAKENINIEEAARSLVNKILLNDKLITAADILDNDKFALAGRSGQESAQPTKKNCSC